MEREKLKGNLDLLLLSVLAAAPAHGYAVITALRERSEGAFDLGEGAAGLGHARKLSPGAPLPAAQKRPWVMLAKSQGSTAT
jgi:hypothetical protein